MNNKKLEIVKSLHNQKEKPYNNNYENSWDNNIGECPSYFWGVCEAKNGVLPCFECPKYY